MHKIEIWTGKFRYTFKENLHKVHTSTMLSRAIIPVSRRAFSTSSVARGSGHSSGPFYTQTHFTNFEGNGVGALLFFL